MATQVAQIPELQRDHPCFDCAVRELAVCGVLEAAALRQFKESGPTVRYEAGDTVVFEADRASSVYSLTSGLLRLSKLSTKNRVVVQFENSGIQIGNRLCINDDSIGLLERSFRSVSQSLVTDRRNFNR